MDDGEDERIPLTCTTTPGSGPLLIRGQAPKVPPKLVKGPPATQTQYDDDPELEGRLEVLEHLISVILQRNSTYLESLLLNEEILDVLDLKDPRGFNSLHIACDQGDLRIIRLLVGAGASPNERDGFGRTPLHWVVHGGCRCQGCSVTRATCVQVLLESRANPEVEDDLGETPLAYAIKNLLPSCAVKLLEFGAQLSKTCVDGTKLGHLMIQNMPEVMVQLLDASISYDEEDFSKLKIDFEWVKVLVQLRSRAEPISKSILNPTRIHPHSKAQNETELLKVMLRSTPEGTRDLLTHPVTEALLHLKWKYVRGWFWLLRIFYFTVTLLYTNFVFQLFIVQCPFKPSPPGEIYINECDVGVRGYGWASHVETLILALGVGGAMFLIGLGEVFELVQDFKGQIRNSLLWWILIGTVIPTLLPGFGLRIQKWNYPLAAFSLFYVWAMNLIHMARIPTFGTYVQMLSKVLQKLALVAFTYTSLFMAFAMGYCVLFTKEPSWRVFPQGILQVFLMMAGEHDYGSTFKVNGKSRFGDLEYYVPAHFFYIGLILFSLLYFNLLLGLAVSDIQTIQRNSELRLVSGQIREIGLLESFLTCALIPNWVSRRILRRMSILHRHGQYLRLSPTNPKDDCGIPPDLRLKFLPFFKDRPCMKGPSSRRGVPGTTTVGSKIHRDDHEDPGVVHSTHHLRPSLGRGLGDPESLGGILDELRVRLENGRRRAP